MITSPGSVFLYVAYFIVFIGYQVWSQTFAAYTIDTYGIGSAELGLLYSVAGIPGILAFLIGFAARRVDMAMLLIATCWLTGIGLAWLALAPTWQALWPGILAIGAGVAGFYPVITSLRLLSDGDEAPSRALGRLKGFGPLAAITAGFVVMVLSPLLGFANLLLVIGIFCVVGGTLAGSKFAKIHLPLRRGALHLRRQLWPVYLLNFLAGCRSALFKSLAAFLLVSQYGFDLNRTAALGVMGSLLTFFGYNLVGRWVAWQNSRTALTGIYAAVALVFLGFGFIDSAVVLVVLYGLDSLLFGASVATESYVRAIVPPAEVVGNVAVGLALFSLASLIVPYLGGLAFASFGREPAFLAASAVAVIALLASRRLAAKPVAVSDASAMVSEARQGTT